MISKQSRALRPAFSLGFHETGCAKVSQKLVKSCNQIICCNHVRYGRCRGNDAGGTGRAGCADRALRTNWALRSGWANCTVSACRPRGAGYSGRPLNALRSRRADCAVRTGWAHGAGCTGRPLSTLRALCALRSGSALRSTGADGALRPGCPLLAGWIDDAGRRNVLSASAAAGNLIVAAARLSDIIRQEQHLLSFCCFERRELVFCSPAYSMPEGGRS